MSDVMERAKEQLETNRYRYSKLCPKCASESFRNGEKCKECGYNSLFVSFKRVPLPTWNEFKQFALDEHSDDHGEAFDRIWNEWKMLREFMDIISNLDGRIMRLEQNVSKEEKKEIKNILGKRIGDKSVGKTSDG